MMPGVRRALTPYGLDLPFTAAICPRHAKTIRVQPDASVDVSLERTLVFLRPPKPRDLCDRVPLAAGEGTIHESPDARDLLTTHTAQGTVVYWAPREPIVPAALYVHRRDWSAAGSAGDAAIYTGFHCEVRTGVAVVELSAPDLFEAAVAFPWPRWQRIRSVQTIVRHALRHLDAGGGVLPEMLDAGTRVRWTFVAPPVGQRYACVAFHEQGVALWRQRFDADTLPARLRRLVGAVTSF